jgi:ring-1,2-phenylacetyl-CoA epoxidase subunit PaaC
MRQFLFDAWHIELIGALTQSSDGRIREIAAKAQKEVAYHVERSAELVIALGDGTAESHARMQSALAALWSYTGELFLADPIEQSLAAASVIPGPESLKPAWTRTIEAVLSEATLEAPASGFAHKGGKSGRHTEALGFILAEMQFLPRAYPDARW